MSESPSYYTPEQVADRFGLPSANYVRENAKHWPHIKIAKQLRFTEEHVAAIGRLHEHTPVEAVTNRNTFGRRTRGGAA